MSAELLNTETAQLEHALKRFIPELDRETIAREIAGCVWNMVCRAVEQQKEELKR